jgi:hypothetical protein
MSSSSCSTYTRGKLLACLPQGEVFSTFLFLFLGEFFLLLFLERSSSFLNGHGITFVLVVKQMGWQNNFNAGHIECS